MKCSKDFKSLFVSKQPVCFVYIIFFWPLSANMAAHSSYVSHLPTQNSPFPALLFLLFNLQKISPCWQKHNMLHSINPFTILQPSITIQWVAACSGVALGAPCCPVTPAAADEHFCGLRSVKVQKIGSETGRTSQAQELVSYITRNLNQYLNLLWVDDFSSLLRNEAKYQTYLYVEFQVLCMLQIFSICIISNVPNSPQNVHLMHEAYSIL